VKEIETTKTAIYISCHFIRFHLSQGLPIYM